MDTFSASAEGWFAGGGPLGGIPAVPPAVQPGGGPGGAGDPFLRITATGASGPGSRLVAMNGAQWSGDYLAAGVAALEMDLINIGASDLTVRLLFEDPSSGAPPIVRTTPRTSPRP